MTLNCETRSGDDRAALAMLGELLDGRTRVEFDTEDNGDVVCELRRPAFDRPVVHAHGPTPGEALRAAWTEATQR